MDPDLQLNADMKILICLISLSLATSLEAGPVLTESAPSALDNLLKAPTGEGCSQAFEAATSDQNGKFSLRTSVQEKIYNLQSNIELCSGQLTKVLTKPERITSGWLQWDNNCGGENRSIPASAIQTNSTGTQLWIYASEEWIGPNREGCSGLIIFQSSSESLGSEDVLAGSDISTTSITVGHAIKLTKIPPISTNVNNAADLPAAITEPPADGDEVSACGALQFSHSNYLSLALLFALTVIILISHRKQSRGVLHG